MPSPLPSQEQQQAQQTEEQRAKESAALYSNRSAAFLGELHITTIDAYLSH